MTVQRASDRVSASSPDIAPGAGVGVVAMRATSRSWTSPRAVTDAVVKWRSSRRRSSAPDFQIAYSSESARAAADAAMMFVSLPIVDHVARAVRSNR